MSTTSVGRSRTRDAHAGRRGGARLPLVKVAQPGRRASRVPFALVILLLLAAALLTLLLLNTMLAQDAFVLYRLQQQSATLADSEQQLQESVTQAEAPSALASQAAGLGMVPGGDPLFLRVPDGTVLGDPKAARVAVPPAITIRTPTPQPSSSASPSASPSMSPSASSSTRGRVGPSPTPSARGASAPARARKSPPATSRATHRANPGTQPAPQSPRPQHVTPTGRPT
jgi:hypothetical protein